MLCNKSFYVSRKNVLFYSQPFSYCSWGSRGKNAEVVCHCLLQWTMSSPPCLFWVALRGMAHSFIELDKAVVHMINLNSSL